LALTGFFPVKKRHKQFALIISDIDSSEKAERFLKIWVI